MVELKSGLVDLRRKKIKINQQNISVPSILLVNEEIVNLDVYT